MIKKVKKFKFIERILLILLNFSTKIINISKNY